MTRPLLILLAVVLVATGAGSAGAPRVTIAAQPPDLARNRLLTLYGAIASDRAKEIVVLQARECGQKTFRDVARVETSFGGRYSWEYFYPGITASIRAVWRGARSAPVRVRDRAFVELRSLGSGSYAVSVRGKLPFVGKRAELQRLRRPGGWQTIRSLRLTERAVPPGAMYIFSTGRVTADVPAGTLLRAVLPRSQAQPCYLAGYSNMLRD